MTIETDEPATHAAPETRPGGARRWILALAGLVALGACIWILRGRGHGTDAGAAGKGGAAADRVVPVTAAKVTVRDVPIVLEGLGNVLPLATVSVKSQVDGRLDKVLFKEGQSVKKGDVLAQVDPRPFTIQLEQAQAALARDEAQLRNAKLNLDRYKTLRAQNLIPQQQLDDQQTLADQLDANVMNDRALVDNARLQLDYARVKSPIDGVAGVRQVDPGNLVHASDQTGIVILTQLDPIAILFTLPEDDLVRVQKQLAAGPVTVEAYARDGVTKLGAGQISVIDNEVNAQTATIRLKAVVPNAERLLWPNAFVKARVLLSTRKGAVTVPSTVVQRGPQGAFAYVIAPDHTVSMRPVEVETTQGELSIVAKGLQPGEEVVADGQNQLRPGAKVAPRPAEHAASSSDGAPGEAPAGAGPHAPPPAGRANVTNGRAGSAP